MAVTLSGQFVTVFIGNAAGVLTDITPYLTNLDPTRSSDPTDLSTFASGGGPVTLNVVRGAAVSEFKLTGLFDPTFAKIVRQIIAARSGVTVQIKSGNNASPTQGDVLFTGSYIPVSYNLVYNGGANATLDLDLKPADGGAIVPTFGTI